MRFIEIVEGLRSTRQKDFPPNLNKNYTIGFELEIHVDDDYKHEFEMSDKEAINSAPYNSEVLLEYIQKKFNYSAPYNAKSIYDFFMQLKDNFDFQENVYTPDEYIEKVKNEILPKKEDENKKDYLIRLYEFRSRRPASRSFIDNVNEIENEPSLLDRNIKTIQKRIQEEEFSEIQDHPYIKSNNLYFNDYVQIFSKHQTTERPVAYFEFLRNNFLNFDNFIEKNKEKIKQFFVKSFDISLYIEEHIEDTAPDMYEYTEQKFGKIIDIDEVIGDSSVTDGVEIITKVYTDINKATTDLKNALQLISDNPYLSTSNETGFHVNIGTFSENDIQKIDLFKFMTILHEDKTLKDFDREYNAYALSQTERLHDILRSYVNKDLKNYINVKSNINNHIISSSKKFNAVNLTKLVNDGYIEFRSMGDNDYETKPNLIITNIKKYLRAFDLASDPNAYKNEYMKILYKLVPNETEDIYPEIKQVLRDTGFKNFVDRVDDPEEFIDFLALTLYSNEKYIEYMKYDPQNENNLIGKLNNAIRLDIINDYKDVTYSHINILLKFFDDNDVKKYAPKLYKLVSNATN